MKPNLTIFFIIISCVFTCCEKKDIKKELKEEITQ
jgi:hypothetical protein